MRALSFILGVITGLSLMLVILFTVFELVIYSDNNLLPRYFEKYDVRANIPNEFHLQLDTIGRKMLNYLKGDEQELQYTVSTEHGDFDFFNEQDIKHMADVRNIFLSSLRIRNISFALLMASIFLNFFIKKIRNTVLKAARRTLLILFVLQIILVIFMLFDFTNIFLLFHKIIFKNDLWLFDPDMDYMINILPEQLFMDISTKIGLIYILSLCLAILVLYGARYAVIGGKNERRCKS